MLVMWERESPFEIIYVFATHIIIYYIIAMIIIIENIICFARIWDMHT